mmetsp:Transcript_27941/g.83303  ORF Transcript_27941/g.83303 Transcript_27941/m.83303 type:complete len:227 (-) Transcript_27941:624-1304(-)
MKRQMDAVTAPFAHSPHRGSPPLGKQLVPTAARTAEQTAMPAADHIRSTVRPFLSTRKMAGKVERMFTRPDTAVKRRPACADSKTDSKISGPSYMNAFRPHICWSSCRATPIDSSFRLSPEKNSPQLGLPLSASCSCSLQICASSILTSSSSPRTETSVLSASAYRPFDASQRGERGMTMPPTARSSPGMSCPRMTQRQPPMGCSTFSRSRAMTNATMMPTVTASW